MEAPNRGKKWHSFWLLVAGWLGLKAFSTKAWLHFALLNQCRSPFCKQSAE